MTNTIDLRNHPTTIEKSNAKKYVTYCTLINKDYELPTCAGFDPEIQILECHDCEVPKQFQEAKNELTKLILTNSL
jgi:hypothetical protein